MKRSILNLIIATLNAQFCHTLFVTRAIIAFFFSSWLTLTTLTLVCLTSSVWSLPTTSAKTSPTCRCSSRCTTTSQRISTTTLQSSMPSRYYFSISTPTDLVSLESVGNSGKFSEHSNQNVITNRRLFFLKKQVKPGFTNNYQPPGFRQSKQIWSINKTKTKKYCQPFSKNSLLEKIGLIKEFKICLKFISNF